MIDQNPEMFRRITRPIAALAILTVVVAVAPADEPAATARWYKGNTHTHSLWSDGNDFPEMIVAWYRERDYDFLALSDHNVLSRGERWTNVDGVAKREAGGKLVDRLVDGQAVEVGRVRRRWADDVVGHARRGWHQGEVDAVVAGVDTVAMARPRGRR